MRRERLVVVAVLVATGTLGCGEGGTDGSGGGEPGAIAPQPGEDAPESREARALLEELRARHQVLAPAAPRDPLSLKQPSLRPRRPLLGPAPAVRFSREATQLRAAWAEPPAADLELRLPLQSLDPFRLADRQSGVAVQARLLEARSASAEVVGGYVVYRDAGPGGGHIVHRVTDAGTEDYVTFDARPSREEIRYDITLSAQVAGLRLVDDTLELLDAASTPRLRVSPPFIAGADGETRRAALSVAGCAVDRDPSPPWDRPVVPPGAARCQLQIRWDGADVAYPAILDPSWSTTASMAAARTRFIGVAVSSGARVLVSGGWTNNQSFPLSSAEVYNSSTRTWSTTANMGTARAEHAAALRGNGSVLVTGGTNGTVSLSSAKSWSPTTGLWTSHGAMSAAREQHRATALANGDVLISGGTVNGSLGAQRFVNSNATWSNAGTMLSFHAAHSATLLTDGRVLSVGGESPTSQLYDPAANSWSASAVQAKPRTGHAAVRLANGNVMVTGGFGDLFSSVELFDPATGNWSTTGNLWQSHALHTATRLNDGRVLVFGNFAGDNHTAAEIYDPTWGTWRPGPLTSTSSLRDQHVAALLSNGRVLMAGGTAAAGSGALSSAVELVPTTTATIATEYKSGTGGLPAPAVDPDVLSDRVTELWAVVHRPNPMPAGRLPLLIFLHGNHRTCGYSSNPRIDDNILYTTTGTCPAPTPTRTYVVAPSHRGYDYVASELASRGYLVVSINANRGINHGDSFPGDDDLIAARGNLILKHLQRLSEWSRGVSPTPSTIGVNLTNKLDLTQVGLMGHSRGGEGARWAYSLYKQAGSPWPGRIVSPVTFRGIFEIAPTDHVMQPQNPLNTKWSVVLPMCDGDVDDLSGVRPFDRMMGLTETNVSFKSTYTVWGANHNYFNTEWQQTDTFMCTDHMPIFLVDTPGVTGSAEQRGVGLQSMLSFFTANVGSATDPWFNNTFNPEYGVGFLPPVDRGYTPGLSTAQSRMLEDFLGAAGTSSFGLPNIHANVTVTHGPLPEHAAELRGADISWSSPGPPQPFFQTNFTPVGSGLDLTSYQLLDLRIERAYDPPLNSSEPTDFYVQLVQADDTLTQAISIDSYVDLLGPVGSYGIPAIRHSMLQTVRIPLGHFGLANLAAIRGVRLTFATTPTGHIYVANIRATRTSVVSSPMGLAAAQTLAPAGAADTATVAAVAPVSRPRRNPATVTPGTGGRFAPRRISAGNTVVALRTAADGSIKFELATTTPFLGRDASLVLRVGGARSTFIAFTSDDVTRITFTLDRKAFDALAGGEPISVSYERQASDIQWDFGPLDKSQLVP